MKRALLCTLIPLVLVTACGEARKFNGEGDPPPPPATGFDITTANGLQVAQVAYQSVVTSGDIAGLAGSTGLTADAGGSLTKPVMQKPLGGTLGSLVQQIPIGPMTLDCVVGGTLTITADLADPLTLTAGDTILAEYNSCDDGLGEIIHGTLDFIVDAFSGDIFTGIYALTMTMNLDTFQSTVGADVTTANGDGTATLDTTAAPYVEASVSGSVMVMDTNGSTETLTSYSSAQTLDAGLTPAPYTMIASGTLDSSQLSGGITYSTPVMFQGFDVNYPHTGELLVSSEGSSARLVADNDVDVHIDIYSNADGSGTPDDTIVTTWAELAGL
jgi:hypothetical protein